MIKDINLITQLIMSQGMREVHIEIIDKDGNRSKFDYRAHQPTQPTPIDSEVTTLGEHNV